MLGHDLLLALFFTLLLLSGFFSASETGMMALNRYRLAHWARKKKKGARLVQTLLERPDRLLGVILIGNTFANILAASVATALAVTWFGEYGVLLATIVVTTLVLIFAEVLPKTLAARYPNRLSLIVAWPLYLLLKIFYPLVWLVNSFVNGLLRLFGIKVSVPRESDQLSLPELQSLVYTSKKVSLDHQQMLLRVLELESTRVEDVMVPRAMIGAIDLLWDEEHIQAKIKACSYRFVVLYEGELENSQGVLELRQLWMSHKRGQKYTPDQLRLLATESYFVPEGTPIGKQLLVFQKTNQRIAQVVDEFGEILGLLCVSNITNEIIGQWTYQISLPEVAPEGRRQLVVSGSLAVRELNRRLGWQLPTDGARTIGGMIIEYLQVLPDGPFCIMLQGYVFEVQEVRDRQIIRLIVYRRQSF